MSGPLEFRFERGVALVTLRNPPVNAISHAMRVELLDALTRANGDGSVRAVLIAGANHTFVAGADIKEFGQPAQAPFLGEVLNALEASAKPVTVFLQGHALGGGLEIALAAHARVAVPKCSLGLPEVSLGLLPGAGGTQRLPRLVGAAAALDLILSGRSIDAGAALSLGLVDQLVADENAAVTYALAAPIRKTRDNTAPLAATNPQMFEDTLRAKAKSWSGQLAPLKILQAVQLACSLPFDEGLAFEREAFLECRASAQHKALSYLFFAEREAAKLSPAPAAKLELTDVFVLDSGPTAAKLVNWFDAAGLAVRLVSDPSSPGVLVGPVPQPGVIGVEVRDQLVELVVPTENATAESVAALISLARRMGKVPVVTRKTHDFVCNRLCDVSDQAEEGARLLEAGVFARESDIDVLLVAGCKYPRHRGGPMFEARQRCELSSGSL